jgi:fructose-specific phosphotransferase system IIA component
MKKEVKMRLSRMMKKELVKLELNARDKEGVIKEMVELISKDRRIKDKDEVLRAMLSRELLKTTGIGNGVAIPHSRTDAAQDIVIAFARSREGIEFDAVDKRPVTLFFMVAGPERKNEEYLKVMSMIARLLSSEESRSALMNAPTPKDLIRSIERIESRET